MFPDFAKKGNNMRPELIKFLICPRCKNNNLRLRVLNQGGGKIKTGLIVCSSCRHTYPIINYIPSFQKAKFKKNEKQVIDFYSTRWKEIKWQERYLMKRYRALLEKLKLRRVKELKAFLYSKKRVLDVGCGIGTHIATIAPINKKSIIFGIDLSSAIEFAYKNTGDFKNVYLIQSNLFQMPFPNGSFDFIISDGVLHHTRDPKKAFLSLIEYLAPGGHIFVHLNRRLGPIRELSDKLLRNITTKMSLKKCYDFCKQFTRFARSIHKQKINFNVPEDLPVLGIKKGKYELQEFIYKYFFLCYWDWSGSLDFHRNNFTNMDWYYPLYQYTYTAEELLFWCKKADLINVEVYPACLDGISIKAQKKVKIYEKA